ERRLRIARHRARSNRVEVRFGVLDRGKDIRCSPARGDTDDDVARSAHIAEITRASPSLILGALDRHAKRMVPARDDPGDELRFHAERRRHLARVENAEAAARPSANVEQTMTARERRDDEIDGPLYLGDRGADRPRDGRVLVVDELQDLT